MFADPAADALPWAAELAASFSWLSDLRQGDTFNAPDL